MVAVSSLSFAMDAKLLKETALKACDTQSAQVPENMRAQVKKTCVCAVNKTDYEALLTAQTSGNVEAVQAEAMKVAQECAAEAM